MSEGHQIDLNHMEFFGQIILVEWAVHIKSGVIDQDINDNGFPVQCVVNLPGSGVQGQVFRKYFSGYAKLPAGFRCYFSQSGHGPGHQHQVVSVPGEFQCQPPSDTARGACYKRSGLSV